MNHPYVVWNLEVLRITPAQRDALLARRVVYDADPDGSEGMPGCHYPEEGYDLAAVRAAAARLEEEWATANPEGCPAVAAALRSSFQIWWEALEERLLALGAVGSTWGEVEPFWERGVPAHSAATGVCSARLLAGRPVFLKSVEV